MASRIAYLQVLGTDTADTTPGCFLFTDRQRYLFNVGENTQRFCLEHGVRPTKINHVFLSDITPESSAGLPGMLLTIADAGATQLQVHGPRNTERFLQATRYFMQRTAFKLTIKEHDNAPDGAEPQPFQDEDITVWPVIIHAKPEARSGEEPPAKKARGAGGALALPPICVYVAKVADTPGKFNPVRARELKLTPGPDYARLTRGESVRNADDVLIRPDQVIGPPVPGPVSIVLRCPDLGYIDSLVSHPGLAECYAGGSRAARLVVHMTEQAVLDDERYRKWMERFGDDCAHIVVNAKQSPQRVIFRAAAAHNARLSAIDERVFPVPHFQNPSEASCKQPAALPGLPGRAVAGDAMMKFVLKPPEKLGVLCDEVPGPVGLETVRGRCCGCPTSSPPGTACSRGWPRPAWPRRRPRPGPRGSPRSPRRRGKGRGDTGGLEDAAELLVSGGAPAPAGPGRPASPPPARATVDCLSEPCPPFLQNISPREAELVFLGTGSALPSKLRNVSAIFLNLFDKGTVLLDCGEGTYGQIVRKYGAEGARTALAGLRLVWISHFHADHHVGLVKILEERWLLKQEGLIPRDDTVLVVGPFQVGSWLRDYNRLYPLDYEFVDCKEIKETGSGGGGLVTKAKEALGLSSLSNVPVIHCTEAYAAILESKTGWKLVYSGDTRPCPALVEAGRGATLLIHEATLEDSMLEDAKAKRHSTFSEALDVGRRMEAFRVILTHFSQRYPNVPALEVGGAGHLTLAFDLMTVNFAQLRALPLLLEPVSRLFDMSRREPEDEDERGMTRILSAP
eukprot:tig00021133_g18909.t1